MRFHTSRAAPRAFPSPSVTGPRRRAVVLALLLTGLAGCQSDDLVRAPETALAPAPRARPIINGTEVTATSFTNTWSFVATLARPAVGGGYQTFCTASVIAPRWVLTAAHCVKGLSATDVFVAVGDRDLQGSGIRYKAVKTVLVPSFYREADLFADMAALELVEDANVPRAPFSDDGVSLNMPLRVAGFGLTENGTLSTLLRTTSIAASGPSSVFSAFLAIGTGTGTCSGDSGGPAINDAGELVGLVSFGPGGCRESSYLSGFTYVNYARQWLKVAAPTAVDRTAPNVDVTLDSDIVNLRNAVSVRAAVSDDVEFDEDVDFAHNGAIGSVEASIDNGVTWVPMAPTDGSFGSAEESATVQLFAPAVGNHTVCVRATDVARNVSTSKCTALTAYDPEAAGFVVGNGTFHAPPGSFPFQSTVADDVDFQFMAAYKKGQTTPTGKTLLQFRTRQWRLESANYEYLLVTGSNRAQFRGSGVMKITYGADPADFELYPVKFQIWASADNQTVRVRIWEPAGNERTYFDSSDQPLRTGRIVVHTARNK